MAGAGDSVFAPQMGQGVGCLHGGCWLLVISYWLLVISSLMVLQGYAGIRSVRGHTLPVKAQELAQDYA